MKKYLLPFLLLPFLNTSTTAQVLTREDSLNAGLNPSTKNVILGGYGEAKYSYDKNFETATASLTRAVLFVGYRFTPKMTLFSEFEVEAAKVDDEGGEFSVEQCVIKFDLNRNHYLLAGLVIPRIGIMNENHLPTTYYGNDRPVVEQMVIPSTWREIGVGYYGNSNQLAGLNWSLGIYNGLNGEALKGGTGLSEASYGGRNASASNISTTGSLLYFTGGLRLQASAYYGGSIGLTPRSADSLKLNTGGFSTPVALGEFNATYRIKGFTVKALGSYCTIKNAQSLNTAFASNTPESMYGMYVELAYNILEPTKWKEKKLVAFTRFESLDLMATVPDNGIRDEQYKQNYFIAGLNYFPGKAIAVKADWKHVSTGDPNPALIFNPAPNAPAYIPTNDFYQLGLAYSF